MLPAVLLSCAVIALIFYYLRENKDYWRKRKVVQFDGVLRTFLWGNRSLSELYKELYDRYSDEKYVGLFVGRKPTILLKDVNDISAVLQSDFQSFNSRGFVTNPKDLLADNLLFMNDYPRWKLMRHKLSPIFTHMKLKNMYYTMERCARDFVAFVESKAPMEKNFFSVLYTYTTASTAAAVFGIDTKTQNTMDCPFMAMAWKTFEPTLIDNLKFAVSNYSPSLFKMLNLKNFSQHEKFFIGVVKKVLEDRRICKETRNDFIDICLELQQNGILRDATTDFELEPTDELLAAQAFFFFTAGADPSASTMNYTLLELSNNPSILKRLHEEIDKVFESSGGKFVYEDIDKLVYLDMVINESMRMYPPVGVIQRKCGRNTVLPSGLKIEENTIALIPLFALHRDEKYFAKPDVFDPERFLPDNASNIIKCTNMPFGGGNRVCIGARFARLQIKVGLALLLRRFTLREQNYKPLHFEPSFFSLRDPKVTYELVPRDRR